MKKKRVVVIGAGLSGLSSAALLARNGFRVTVIDKQSTPGGVARHFTSNGFTFDRGPSWYLMPEVFERFFDAFGKTSADFYRLVPLDPSYKVFFGPGQSQLIKRDQGYMCRLFETLEAGAGRKLEKYLHDARFKYETAMQDFLYREYRSVFDFFNKKTIFGGLKLNLFQSLDRHIRQFFSNKQLQKLLGYNVVFIGCSPFKSPAFYSLMSHVDITLGVYYPLGGISSLVQALYQLAMDHGVQFIFGEQAKSINVTRGKATSVKTTGRTIEGDAVLAAVDYHHAEQDLLSPEYRRYKSSYWDKRLLAPSAFIVHLGLDRKVPGLEHHNLFLSSRWERHFQTIFDQPAWPENPSYYIGCPSKTDPSVAPRGGENLFILVPVAPGLDDGKETREKFSNAAINHLQELLDFGFTDAVRFKKVISQRDFRTSYNLFKGTAMGLAHTFSQSALFRPAHRSKKVVNLYYSSHYTHPGIGMPMVIISSHIITDIIKSSLT